jgi:hypothetical protein|tara:strand:+ start:375 stop:548 length:174 start_codon:yes stop_codon:yes gene_type:complete
MKRKMMTKETVPDNSTTNGGNGAYMRRAIMQKPKGGMTGPVTATGRPTVKSIAPKKG